MQIPGLSIFFMLVSAILSIGLPVFLFLFFRKKYGLKVLPMLLGTAGFIVFALVLESAVHNIVIGRYITVEMPALYVIYGIFMAGIFEESARFIIFTAMKKKYNGIGTALSYGIGHGGIEAILLAGLSMITAVVWSILVNTGNIEAIIGSLEGDALASVNTQLTALIVTEPYMFLVSGIERVLAITIQLSLSVIVFYAVYGTRKLWLYPLAIVLHAVIDLSAILYQIGVIKNIVLVEALVFAGAVGLVILAKFIHDKLKACS